MKRSEAIQLIANIIYELNVEADECDWEADKILTKLEKAGMLPPHVTEQVKTTAIVATPLGYQELVVEDSQVFISRWEEETDS